MSTNTATSKKPNKSNSKKKDKIIAWQTPEYEYIEKTKDWYWVVGAIGVLVSIGSFWIGNWSFGSLVVLVTLVLIYLAMRKPGIVQVKFNTTKKTISVESKIYYLKNYQAFNISEYSGDLLLQSTKTLAPLSTIPLPEDAPSEKIIDVLEDELDFVQDETLQEPFLEIIMHRLGF